MKNVMAKAWEIARVAQIRFGGKVKEYFAESLKEAWAQIKSYKEMKTRNVQTVFLAVIGKFTNLIAKVEDNVKKYILSDYMTNDYEEFENMEEAVKMFKSWEQEYKTPDYPRNTIWY